MHPMDKAKAYQAIHDNYGNLNQVAKETPVSARTIRKYLYLLDLESSIQKDVTTSGGSIGIEALAELARIFPDKEQQREVLEKIRGFVQPIQVEILKKSRGDFDSIDDLVEQARDDAFNTRTCAEGLCFAMSEDMKREVRKLLET